MLMSYDKLYSENESTTKFLWIIYAKKKHFDSSKHFMEMFM